MVLTQSLTFETIAPAIHKIVVIGFIRMDWNVFHVRRYLSLSNGIH